jgi:hypothetical protein
MQPSQPTQCLLDQDIREALKKTLREQDRNAAIIEELPLQRGRGRADLAFVNGELWGFEIKSEADSLIRLGIQREHYESACGCGKTSETCQATHSEGMGNNRS